MPLFQRRRRNLEKQRRIAAGTPPALTAEFTEQQRTKVFWAMANTAPGHAQDRVRIYPAWPDIAAAMRKEVLEEWGRLALGGRTDPGQDIGEYLIRRATADEIGDLIEAWVSAMQGFALTMDDWYTRHKVEEAIEEFRRRVNDVFDDEDLAYQLVGTEIVERSSMVMHAQVIAPTLALLHGEPQLSQVEAAFQDALKELKPGGDPADAITDAGTALQELLVALGASGQSLGQLLADAKKKEILGPYDSKLAAGIEEIGEWVSADRSQRGDSHRASEAVRDDAWLAVHVVGALIIRLAKRIA